jgi:uncharacterized repeat protein (TIGR01451 family)
VEIGSKTRVLGSMVALVVPLVLSGAVTSPATAAAVPAGGFAESYGLLVDTTIIQGNQAVKVGPRAAVASSCPPAGGAKTGQELGVGDAQVARADVLNTGAATDCTLKKSLASAQTLNADALNVAAPIKIHADAITSTASVTCASGPVGTTVIANLSVGGTAIPLPSPVPPNTEVAAAIFNPLGLRVLLNEQHPAASGRGLVVNGLHIIASNTGVVPVGGGVIRGDVVISHAMAGVVCPGGPGTNNGGLPKPDITFDKTATPKSVHPGDTVTYTATVTNTSTTGCLVLKFIEHVAPVFDLVSSAGPLGTKLDSPAPARTDGGVDAVLRPTGVTIAPGKSVVQTFTVKVKDGATPGTYYDSLEIYCGPNGNFVSGPLAPVTVLAPTTPPGVTPPVTVVDAPPTLPRTGGIPLVAAGALLLMAAGFGLRRVRLAQD